MSATSRSHTDELTIRTAVPADHARLDRLAQLDSARLPSGGRILVAEAGGQLRAALSVESGQVIADPFERTAGVVALLREHARQIEPSRRRSWRIVPRGFRAATASRA